MVGFAIGAFLFYAIGITLTLLLAVIDWAQRRHR